MRLIVLLVLFTYFACVPCFGQTQSAAPRQASYPAPVQGRYVLIPITDQTRGHGTHSLPVIWQEHLKETATTNRAETSVVGGQGSVVHGQ
jgi:hypothetical protein